MENTLKIGQRIDIYKVLNDGGYTYGSFTPGTFRAGSETRGALTDLINEHPYQELFPTLSMLIGVEAELVGTMIVKKLKTPPQIFEPSY